MRSHRHLIQINPEVNKNTIVEVEDELLGISVIHVLMLGVADGLIGELVLQLKRDDRNAVQGKNHINSVMVLRGVSKLPCLGENVCIILLHQFFIVLGGRCEVCELELHPPVHNPITQDMD